MTVNVTLHLGDCLDVLKTLDAGSIDAVVTDPPYGVNFVCGSPDGRIRASAIARHRKPIHGDNEPFDPAPFLGYRTVIMFGANNFADRLPPSRGWIFWSKRPGMKPNDFGDGEMIWTNADRPIRMFEYMWNGVLQDGEKGQSKYHPTQKPLALMMWLLNNYTKPGDTILDPFMGSGTTGVACVKTGRHFIGCEIDPTYHAIAARRIAEAQMQLPLLEVL